MTHTKYFLKDGDFYGNGHAIPHPINPTVVAEIYNNSGKPGRIHLDADGWFVLTQKGQGDHRLDSQGMLRLLNSIEGPGWYLQQCGRFKRPTSDEALPCPISGPYRLGTGSDTKPDCIYNGGEALDQRDAVHELNRLHNALEQARKARNISELRLKSKDLEVAKDRIDAKIEALDKEGLGHD